MKNRVPSRTSSACKLAPRASGNVHSRSPIVGKDARPNTIGGLLSTRRFGELPRGA
jgi:hypothetical protein